MSDLPRDASLEQILTEVYRLAAALDRVQLELAGVRARQSEHLELGSRVEGHHVLINDHDEKISGLERSVVRIDKGVSRLETSVDRIRENAALYGKAQERRDDKLQATLDRLVEMHQPTAVIGTPL